MNGHAPTPEQAAEMARLYQEGLSAKEVAARTGFSHTTVFRYLRILGVPTRPGGNVRPPHDPVAIVAAYTAGGTLRSIAAGTGLGYTTVRAVLLENGCEMHPRGGWRTNAIKR